MSNIFEKIKQLYDYELYSNVIPLSELIFSLCENNVDILTSPNKLTLMLYYANSLYYDNQYQRAANAYRKVLTYKKKLVWPKNSTKSNENCKDMMNEVNLKYNLHESLVNLSDNSQALNVLISIPNKQRTPKINMAIGKLAQREKNDRIAFNAYKEVLKECLALEAIDSLFSFNNIDIQFDVIHDLVKMHLNDCSMFIKNIFSAWVKAKCLFHTKKYQEALAVLKPLEEYNVFNRNVHLSTWIGEIHYRLCDYDEAVDYFKKAHVTNHFQKKGLDMLVLSLVKLEKYDELEKYITVLLSAIESKDFTAQNWIALACYLHYVKKSPKALHFAQRGVAVAPHNVEALVTKAQILQDYKKYSEAIQLYREALDILPSFPIYKGIVDCFIGENNFREAISFAGNACLVEPTIEAYTLLAQVLTKDKNQIAKAKSHLEKVLEKNPNYLKATYLLAEIYELEKQYEPAINLLEKQLKNNPNGRIYSMLGDIYMKLNNEEKAIHHFSLALRLEPLNRHAFEVLHSIDAASRGNKKLDSSRFFVSASTPNSTMHTSNQQINENDSIPGSSGSRLVESNEMDTVVYDEVGLGDAGIGTNTNSDQEADNMSGNATWSDNEFDNNFIAETIESVVQIGANTPSHI